MQAKNACFSAIKQAKKDHWNQFLEKEDLKSIFKALAYTKNRLVEKILSISNKTDFYNKCKVFRETLFPTPPSAPKPTWDRYRPYNWNRPSLARSELKNACSAKIKGKTPGLNLINQDIIQQAYKAIPNIFFKLYSSLLDLGYYLKY